jgi:serine O-acetyltransferase
VVSLISQIFEDYVAHDRRWSVPGFQAIATYRLGRWKKTIKSRIVRAPLTVLADSMKVFCRNFYGIELPFEATIGRRVVIYHQHGIVIHGNSVIGDDCIIRQGVTLGIRKMNDCDAAPILGNGVDIGAGAKILGSIKIGDGAKIGANAVVLKDIPANATAIGVPAQIWNPRSHHPTVAN